MNFVHLNSIERSMVDHRRAYSTIGKGTSMYLQFQVGLKTVQKF